MQTSQGISTVPKHRVSFSRNETKFTRNCRGKSRHGCGTCKKRHKKCDEAKPFCKTCLTKGYKCDGYEDALPSWGRFSTAKTSPNVSSTISFPNRGLFSLGKDQALALKSTLSLFPGFEPREIRAFEAFRTLSVPQLTAAFDDDFFGRMLPRAGLHAPAIKHALVAVGALHAEAERANGTLRLEPSSHSTFILEQYGKTLASVVKVAKQEGRKAADIILTVCLLCVLFESLRGNFDAAQMHTQSGVSFLREMTKPTSGVGKDLSFPSEAAGVPMARLTSLMMRLDLQASDPSDVSGWNRVANTENLVEPPPVPAVFESVEHSRATVIYNEYCFMLELRRAMQANGKDMTKWTDAQMDTMWSMRNRYIDFLESWNRTQRASMANLRQSMDARARLGLLLLEMNHLWIRATAELFPIFEEVRFDDFHESFKRILEIATQVIEEGPARTVKFAFSFDVGLSEPLFWMTMKCRDPCMRRRAKQLLSKCPIRQGIYNSQLATMISERAIQLEESHSGRPVIHASDVPREARIMFLCPTYLKAEGCFQIRLSNIYGLCEETKIEYDGIIKSKRN